MTRWAVLSARRFHNRCIDNALLGLPPLWRSGSADVLRSQRRAWTAGVIFAVVMIIITGVTAALRPVSFGAVADSAPLVMDRHSGALFVRITETFHPVANLASARLILNAPVNPQIIDLDHHGKDSRSADSRNRNFSIGDYRLEYGPILGISAAPHYLGSPRHDGETTGNGEISWMVCDSDDGKTAIAIDMPDGPPVMEQQTALLVSGSASAVSEDSPVYLLYDGYRAVIDHHDPVIVRTFHLEGAAVRRVSQTVLASIPERAPITVPHITHSGQPSLISGFLVGSVLRVVRAEVTEFYVVLREGLQRVGQLSADLIRFTNSQGGAHIVTVAPKVVAGVPLVEELPVSTYPDAVPRLLPATGTLCVTWIAGDTSLGWVQQPSELFSAHQLAQADGPGPGIDAVWVPAGCSIDVEVATVTGSSFVHSRYLIADGGVRFAVSDSAAATALGLTDPVSGPWSLISALPAGPNLSRQAALVAYDSFSSSGSGGSGPSGSGSVSRNAPLMPSP